MHPNQFFSFAAVREAAKKFLHYWSDHTKALWYLFLVVRSFPPPPLSLSLLVLRPLFEEIFLRLPLQPTTGHNYT